MIFSDAQHAAQLINTKSLPPGLSHIQALAAQARAYDVLKPYPLHWFKNWKEEDRGPLPRCMPIAKSIVKRGARWLFGKPIELKCPGNDALEEAVEKVWKQNRLDSRLVAIARRGAIEGGVALKFAYDETAFPNVTVQSLSIVSQVRLFYHPHNREKLMMARVQYPYYDSAEGCAYWYREEWTDAQEVHYYPVKDEALHRANPDTYTGWEIDTEASGANPFGLIPIHLIKNIETDDVWGAGDLWEPDDELDGGLYRVLDRIHLTYHLMDKSNQFDSQVNPIFIDADADQDDLSKPQLPGQPLVLESTNPEGGRAGQVAFPPSGNALRPAMMEYAHDLRKQILTATSSVEVDQSEISNMGNLTSAVLTQLYLPQIELTEDKRKTYGQDGIAPFLAKMAIGLQRAGVPMGVNEADDSTYTIEIGWSPYFPFTEDEKTAIVTRIQQEEGAGYLTHDRAIEEVSEMEGRTEIEEMKAELASQAVTEPPEGGDVNDENAGA